MAPAVRNGKPGLTKLGKQADIVVEVGLTRCGVVLGFLKSLLQTCHSALQFCRLPALASERQNSFFPDGSKELVSLSFVSGIWLPREPPRVV